jgi:hypothetical protein
MRFDPTGRAVELETRNPDEFYNRVSSLVLEDGLTIDGLSSPDNNLESVFRYLVGG